MSALNLIMPMAGRGSRFAKQGIQEPKPLVDLGGKPFFWWAVESVRRALPLDQMIFVVLQEHIDAWSLDKCILSYYPQADIIAIPEVTSGSAETAALAIRNLKSAHPFVINDCDHAFVASGLKHAVAKLENSFAGCLMTFNSDSQNYSFVKLNNDGSVSGTVEKEVASPFAIAGCYLFAAPSIFEDQYRSYSRDCPYNELYVSGIYNELLRNHLKVDHVVLDEHFAFGTPEEYAAVQSRMLDQLADWR